MLLHFQYNIVTFQLKINTVLITLMHKNIFEAIVLTKKLTTKRMTKSPSYTITLIAAYCSFTYDSSDDNDHKQLSQQRFRRQLPRSSFPFLAIFTTLLLSIGKTNS